MKDELLVERAVNGDIDAFDALVIRYQKDVFFLIRGLVMDVEDAREATQNTFIKAFRRLKTLKNRERFKQWLYSIAINTARDVLRNRKPQDEYNPKTTGHHNTPEEMLLQKEKRILLRKAIKGLSQRQREVVMLRVYKGLQFSEIGQVLGISSEAARTHFHLGVKTLIKTLKETGYEV